MKRITGIAVISAVVLLMVIAVLVYITPRLGYRADNVGSGSMEPTISTYSMVVAHKVDPAVLKAEDIIIFKPAIGETNVCHKIVTVNNTIPLSFVTGGDAYKGDPSRYPDLLPVPAANVLGKVEFHAPIVGFFIMFLRTPIGLVIGLVFPALIVIYLVFRILWREIVRNIRNTPPKEG